MTETAGAEGTVGERRITLLGYDVRIAPWLLDATGRVVREVAPAHTIAVITDEQVAPFHAAHVVGSLRHFSGAHRIIYRAIPAGERHKTRDVWSALTDWMLDERCGRDTTVVALGGGVVGDLAGFVAATFMRGVPFVQVPTSLLAMVDASVGGKVGVDTPAGKNLVGAFHQPAAVVIDPTVLQTLPLEHLRAGLAEVIKHGIIADAVYLGEATAVGRQLLAARDEAPATATSPLPWHGEALSALIARSVEIKGAVVQDDERERGRRQILNFGHTIGHAIETASGFSLLHGEAIAIGMVLEAGLAEHAGVAQPGTRDAVVAALDAVSLPVVLPEGAAYDPAALVALMHGDKKTKRGVITMALPEAPGVMAGGDRGYGVPVGDDLVLTALAR